MKIKKLDPYVMMPVRRAYIDVIGRLWQGTASTHRYLLTDQDLASLEGQFTRASVGEWLKTHSGDFQTISDFSAFCGSLELDWDLPNSEEMYNDFGCDEEYDNQFDHYKE